MDPIIKKKNTSKSRIAACFVIIALVAVILTLALSSCSFFSTEIVLKHLDIVVDIGADGTTTFTETSTARFSEQDTEWWNFYRIIDDEGLIKNLYNDKSYFTVDASSFKVDGKSVEFAGAIDLDDSSAKSTYTSKYRNQAAGYFFVRQSGVEIGVIMPEFSSGTHTISYKYSVKGIVTGIADASVFYYQYVSEINNMDIDKMSVTVNFPKEEPELRAWLHTSASAIGAWKQSEDKKSVSIEVEDISNGEYIESRMLLFAGGYKVYETDKNTTSIDVATEEQEWYDSYMKEVRLRLFFTILDYVLAVLAVGFGVFWIFHLKRGNRPIDLPDAPIYYRDIPEGYTGGEVSPLYFYYTNENYIDESISATMLELVRKNYITITPDEGKKNAVITVLKKDDQSELRTHQKMVVDMLLTVKPLGTPFTMKEFEKFAKNNSERFTHMVERYKEAILNKSQRDGAYRKENPAKEKAQKFATTMVIIGVVVLVISGFTSFVLGQGMTFFAIGLIIGGLLPYLFLRKAKAPLTIPGQMEYNKLQALGRYMQEFSSLDEHEIPELALWEDYMVFATAMGIADKVAEQLEIAYPEFKQLSVRGFDDRFLILYFFSRSFRMMTGLNFIGNVANVIRSVEMAQKAAKAAEMAQKFGNTFGNGGGGFGGGGGFHGGGGGFGGGGFGGRR